MCWKHSSPSGSSCIGQLWGCQDHSVCATLVSGKSAMSKGKWTDWKDWVMGIVAALIIFALTGLAARFFDPADERAPGIYLKQDVSAGTHITYDLVIHFTLVMNQAILGLALLAAKTESVERRFSKTSGGGSLNGLPASKLAASICSVSAGQRGSFVRTARPRRVGRPDEARCSVAGADARPLPRREPSCTTRGCRCGVGFWPCGWSALRKQG